MLGGVGLLILKVVLAVVQVACIIVNSVIWYKMYQTDKEVSSFVSKMEEE